MLQTTVAEEYDEDEIEVVDLEPEPEVIDLEEIITGLGEEINADRLKFEEEVKTAVANLISKELHDKEEPKSDLCTKRKEPSLLHLLRDQERGFHVEHKLDSCVETLKTSRLRPSPIIRSTHRDLHINNCEFIRPGFDDKSVVGLWSGDQFNGIMYKLLFEISPRSSNVEDASPSMIRAVHQQGPFYAQTQIIDMSDSYYGGQSSMLYAGRRYNENGEMGSTVLCTYVYDSFYAGKQFISRRTIRCCAGSKKGDTFATGTDEGLLLFQHNQFNSIEQFTEKIFALEFDHSGDVLFCGTENFGLMAFDRRTGFFASFLNSLGDVPISFDSGSEIKHLSDGHSVLISLNYGALAKLDVRAKDIVNFYKGHSTSTKKVPFSVNEQLDLLCATGNDKVTRLWSLSTGKLLEAIVPMSIDGKVHSCLLADDNRWAVVLFQKDRMYILENY